MLPAPPFGRLKAETTSLRLQNKYRIARSYANASWQVLFDGKVQVWDVFEHLYVNVLSTTLNILRDGMTFLLRSPFIMKDPDRKSYCRCRSRGTSEGNWVANELTKCRSSSEVVFISCRRVRTQIKTTRTETCNPANLRNLFIQDVALIPKCTRILVFLFVLFLYNITKLTPAASEAALTHCSLTLVVF